MRTWSAVGRVVRPRGVVSRWPLSAPASTRISESPSPRWGEGRVRGQGGAVTAWSRTAPTRRPSTLHWPPSRSSAYSTRSHTGLCSVPPVASTTKTTREGLRRIWSTRKSENRRSPAPLACAYSSTVPRPCRLHSACTRPDRRLQHGANRRVRSHAW